MAVATVSKVFVKSCKNKKHAVIACFILVLTKFLQTYKHFAHKILKMQGFVSENFESKNVFFVKLNRTVVERDNLQRRFSGFVLPPGVLRRRVRFFDILQNASPASVG